MKKVLFVLAAIGLGLTSLPASAADLYLLCNVKSSANDGSQSTYQLRYEITWDTRALRIYRNNGNGWSFVKNLSIAGANDDEIVLEDTDVARSAIDRSTGQVVGKLKATGVVRFRGTCQKSTVGNKAF